MVRLYDLGESLTPDKSKVIITITKWGGTKRLQFINKKGVFQWRKYCAKCKHQGKVQAGLGYHIEPTCDRDGDTWRRMNGGIEKECKFWEEGTIDG